MKKIYLIMGLALLMTSLSYTDALAYSRGGCSPRIVVVREIQPDIYYGNKCPVIRHSPVIPLHAQAWYKRSMHHRYHRHKHDRFNNGITIIVRDR